MKVICVGDSCCYGQGVRADEAWPAVLARLTGYDVRNEGLCGETTRLGLERFPMVVQIHKPDAVVIQYGHNDANRWESDGGNIPRVSIDAYVANISEMMMRAARSGAKVVRVLQPHPVAALSRYSRAVDEYRAELVNCLIGIEPPVGSFVPDGKGVHPDVAMHERYAHLVAEWLT